jgi:hypothetical protein
MKIALDTAPQTPMDVVNILNSNYYDIEEDVTIIPFSFSSNGYCDIIHFLEYPLWSSEADGWDYDDEDDGVGDPLPLIDTVKKLYVELHRRIAGATPDKLFIAED